MRIYSMTATFGKLEHETLTLQPGLNVIEAPNEWGKSTWCAFLAAMLYGLDTRAKTTKTALADKERFAPWSGSPMSGRIDLNWNGRNITIERQTARRVPLGAFRAYETETGLPVPELTAANCGAMLLGVEQTVFRRAGFIRFSDLPVTQDEALRRRLNALVTTGDESGAADRLGKELKEQKNRIRYNRSGLLPQAEGQREELEGKLEELEQLNQQSRKLRIRLDELKQWQLQLENHTAALNYAASQQDARRIAQARDAREQGEQLLTQLEHAVADLPAPEDVRRGMEQLEELTARQKHLLLELQQTAVPPASPAEAEPFRNLSAGEALEKARADGAAYTACRGIGPMLPWLTAVFLALIGGIAVFALAEPVWLALPAAAFVLFTVLALRQQVRCRNRMGQLEALYGSSDPQAWLTAAGSHAEALAAWQSATDAHRKARASLEAQLASLQDQLSELCRGEAPEKALQTWKDILRQWESYRNALRDQEKLDRHLQDLQTMARSAPKPQCEDTLAYSEADTRVLLNDALLEQQRLQSRLGQYQGRAETLGRPDELEANLDALRHRISRLEDQYSALTIAQETLLEARQELQRRFAPRIARRAQELLGALTGGRYERLSLGSDFQLQAAAAAEDTLQDAWWRSDGTVDQLYLALRLAVAEELTPDAPLILDDVLVRFDDTRAKAALTILEKEARNQQVILFTCHKREARLLSDQ